MKIRLNINTGEPKDNTDGLQTRPVFAVVFFIAAVLLVCFYNSRKVSLWESRESIGVDSVFKQAAIAYANVAEDIKIRLGLADYFKQETTFWRSAKESPLVFGQPEASLSLYMDGTALPSDSGLVSSGAGFGDSATTTLANATTTVDSPVAVNPPANPEIKKTDSTPSASKKSAPFRVLIVGDSFLAAGGGLGDPLERVLLNYKDTVVTRQGKVSSGLSRQDYFNWPELTQNLIGQHKPNVAIMMFGANDNISIIEADGTLSAGWGGTRWEGKYRERIDQMLDIFSKAGMEVFVIGVPVMKNPTLSETVKYLNSLYEEEVAKYSNAHYIPTWNLLSDSNGNYTDSLVDKDGNRRLVRTSDGVHLQYYAGYYVAEAIIAEMKNYLNLVLK